MAHARTQIRNAVKDLLSLISEFNGHVFTSRFSNLQRGELPSVNIFCLQESNAPGDLHGLTVERTLQLGISIKTAADDYVDDALDILAELVEVEMDSQPTLGDLVKSLQITGTQIQINEDGAESVGEALLQYQIIYFTQANNPAITE